MQRRLQNWFVTCWVAGVACIVFLGSCREAAAQTDAPLSVAELRTTLDQLKQEAADAQSQWDHLQPVYAAELSERTKQRGELAKQLLAGQTELAGLRTLQNDLATRLSDAETGLQRDIRDLDAHMMQRAEQLGVFCAERFGAEDVASQLRNILDTSSRNDEAVVSRFADRCADVLAAFESLHAAATTIRVQRCELRTANGIIEDVRFLSAGHLAYAYETLRDHRVGFALASPADAKGRRWTEALSTQTQQQIRDAMDRIASGAPGVVAMPIDITGRLSVAGMRGNETLGSRIRSGGPIMFPLAALALLSCLLVLERVLFLYGFNRSQPRRIEGILSLCRAGDFAAAEAALKTRRGVIESTLLACLRHRDADAQTLEDAIQEQLLHALPRLRRFQGGLGLIIAVAPLLGLLGTITGIIETFGVIRAFGNANPSLMAGGISEALVTTASGLIVAIPTLLCRGVLRGRMEKLMGDAERYAASLLNILVGGTVR